MVKTNTVVKFVKRDYPKTKKTHQCLKCAKAFDRKSTLIKHEAVHTGEHAHKCDFPGCTKAYTQSGDLNRHKRIIHQNIRAYHCTFEDCGRAFGTKRELQLHNITHTGEKNFSCTFEDCSKTFARQEELNKHLRAHTGEKPYVCDICEYKCSQISQLKVHKRTHTGEKPYQCETCDLAFSTWTSLNRHELIHSGQKPFVCTEENCQYEFRHRQSLNNHYKRYHTDEGQQLQRKDQTKIENVLKSNQLCYTRETQIDFKCAFGSDRGQQFAKIDFVIQNQQHIICVEVDEQEHSNEGYQLSCELRRMMDTYSSLMIAHPQIKNITFIRYNPHAFTLDDKLHKVLKTVRESKLVDVINNYQPTKPFSIIYMYYSSETVGVQQYQPIICNMPDFAEDLKPLVECIVD